MQTRSYPVRVWISAPCPARKIGKSASLRTKIFPVRIRGGVPNFRFLIFDNTEEHTDVATGTASKAVGPLVALRVQLYASSAKIFCFMPCAGDRTATVAASKTAIEGSTPSARAKIKSEWRQKSGWKTTSINFVKYRRDHYHRNAERYIAMSSAYKESHRTKVCATCETD